MIIDLNLKQEVYNQCKVIIEKRISVAEEAVKVAKDAAEQEERSTAGDKYDTARAMSHLDQDMYSKQLNETLHMQKLFNNISPDKKLNVVESGALVATSVAIYFMSVGLGIMDIDKIKVAAISPISPIGSILLGKKVGEKVLFNGKEIKILEVI